MATVKWAVWGSCGIAKLRTIPEGIVPAGNAELVSIYDVNTAGNRELAAKFGVRAVDSAEELLATPVDAVYVATPLYLHHEHVLACARAGKHVLCEKPFTATNRQAVEMAAACKDAGVQLGTAFMLRFHSQHQAALKMIREGKLGKMVSARAQMSCWYPPIQGAWRQNTAQGGGGSLMDLGSHCIDLMEMFLGSVKKAACFINNTIHDYESEDSATAILYFSDGAISTVDAFFCIPESFTLELYGSGGCILANGAMGDAGEMVAILDESSEGRVVQRARAYDKGIPIAPEPVNMYKAEIQEFSQTIINCRKPSINADLGLRNRKILSACYESARTGKVIDI